MTIHELIRKNRSYRRFYQDESVSRNALIDLVDLARLSPSGANLQPLKFFLSTKPEMNAGIFECLSWAGYLKDWPGPVEGERPSAYIVILGDDEIKKPVHTNQGIAGQSILLGAVEKGLGGCIIASVNRQKLRETLGFAGHLEILLVIALGKPKEEVVIENISADKSIRYYRDERGIHHVPKRSVFDLIIE